MRREELVEIASVRGLSLRNTELDYLLPPVQKAFHKAGRER